MERGIQWSTICTCSWTIWHQVAGLQGTWGRSALQRSVGTKEPYRRIIVGNHECNPVESSRLNSTCPSKRLPTCRCNSRCKSMLLHSSNRNRLKITMQCTTHSSSTCSRSSLMRQKKTMAITRASTSSSKRLLNRIMRTTKSENQLISALMYAKHKIDFRGWLALKGKKFEIAPILLNSDSRT